MSDGAIINDQHVPTVLNDISAMYRTNYMGFASFTMLVWDHIDTFETEVEYIWKGRKGLLVYLFLINRYLTPLGFIVNLFAYLSPVWTPERYIYPLLHPPTSFSAMQFSLIPRRAKSRCDHFIRFEGAMTVIGINIVALMMFLRIRALYSRQYFVLGVVIFLYICQITMNSWLLTKGVAVVHNERSGVLACTMIFDPSISVAASSSAWLPLLYDTAAFILILNRTIPSIRNKNMSFVMRRLLEDGLIYYSAIFAVTGVLTIMIIAAPPGLKNITAQLELLLTVAMMSRITLNLKKSVGKFNDTTVRAELPSFFGRRTLATSMGGNTSIKIISPGFNSREEVSGQMEDKDTYHTPMITIVSPKRGSTRPAVNLPNLSTSTSTWGSTWDSSQLSPIPEVQPSVKFQVETTVSRDP